MTRRERERLAGIKASAVQARQAWRQHRQGCRLCAQLSKNRSQYCSTGWLIRTDLHVAEQALAEKTRPIPQQVARLF